jgi:hypothetical protein
MSSITVDATLREKLRGVQRSVELRDESGMVLGFFTPIIDPAEWESVEPEISEEELLRREQSNEPRYTMAEVIAYLEKL